MMEIADDRGHLVPAPLAADPSMADERPLPDVRRCQVRFDDPDHAYLVAAAVRRYLDASVVTDVILVPTDDGPALDVPVAALSQPPMRGLIARFNGRVAATRGGE